MDGIGPEGGLWCEVERSVVEIGELEVASAGEGGLGYVGPGHSDVQVVDAG